MEKFSNYALGFLRAAAEQGLDPDALEHAISAGLQKSASNERYPAMDPWDAKKQYTEPNLWELAYSSINGTEDLPGIDGEEFNEFYRHGVKIPYLTKHKTESEAYRYLDQDRSKIPQMWLDWQKRKLAEQAEDAAFMAKWVTPYQKASENKNTDIPLTSIPGEVSTDGMTNEQATFGDQDWKRIFKIKGAPDSRLNKKADWQDVGDYALPTIVGTAAGGGLGRLVAGGVAAANSPEGTAGSADSPGTPAHIGGMIGGAGLGALLGHLINKRRKERELNKQAGIDFMLPGAAVAGVGAGLLGAGMVALPMAAGAAAGYGGANLYHQLTKDDEQPTIEDMKANELAKEILLRKRDLLERGISREKKRLK